MPVQINHEEPKFQIQTGQIAHADIDDDEIEIIDPGDLGIDELWDKFHDYNETFLVLGRKSVQEAWLAGHVLCGLKEKILHGEWLNALAEQDIANQTANRYMRLRRAYEEIPQLEEFDSITDAMKALQPKKEDLWTEVDVEGVSAGNVSAGVSNDDEEPEDVGWEVMRAAAEKAEEAFKTCDGTLDRYGLAHVLLGWLVELNEEMKNAIIDYGRPTTVEEESE